MPSVNAGLGQSGNRGCNPTHIKITMILFYTKKNSTYVYWMRVVIVLERFAEIIRRIRNCSFFLPLFQRIVGICAIKAQFFCRRQRNRHLYNKLVSWLLEASVCVHTWFSNVKKFYAPCIRILSLVFFVSLSLSGGPYSANETYKLYLTTQEPLYTIVN